MKRQGLSRILSSLLPPLCFGLFMALMLETKMLHFVFSVNEVQLPLLSSIIHVLAENSGKIARDSWVTLQVFLTGLAIGSLGGFFVALVAVFSPFWGMGGLAVVSAFNAIPIVALSPIMRLWFSQSPFAAKTAVVSIVCMVAMSVNAYRGLSDLKPFSLDLMKSYAAGKIDILLKLRLPNCLPYIFAALRINIASAMIGVIISEYFASSVEGLGFVIRNSLRTMQLTTGWAYILLASLIGIGFYILVALVEKLLLRNR
jgi:NitT/TauT family transport system permease protein